MRCSNGQRAHWSMLRRWKRLCHLFKPRISVTIRPIRVCVYVAHVSECTYACVCVYEYIVLMNVWLQTYVCMYVCMYKYVFLWMHAYDCKRTYVCTYECIVCRCVLRMCVCVCVCVRVCSQEGAGTPWPFTTPRQCWLVTDAHIITPMSKCS